MKIAISACGNGWDHQVDERFGRAAGFFVVDTTDNATSYIDNGANTEAGHGAGTGAARSVVDAGVSVVVTGRIGPKAGAVLRAAGVNVMTGVGRTSVREAYEQYQRGALHEEGL
jgi:predicted Fe-Mo cluster-binding NifX family protein